MSAHAFRSAGMPWTLDEPGLGHEPAGFATRRLEIYVLRIPEKLRWRRTEKNHTPGMYGARDMNKAAFCINMAETMFDQKAGLIQGGLSIKVMGDTLDPLLFEDAKLNDLNSLLSKKRDDPAPLIQRNILCRLVVSFSSLGRQRFQVEAMMDGHVAFGS